MTILYNYPLMQAGVADIKAHAQKVREETETMGNRIEGIIRERLGGQAAEAFHTIFMSWMKDCDVMVQATDALSLVLDGSVTNMQGTDSNNARRFGGDVR